MKGQAPSIAVLQHLATNLRRGSTGRAKPVREACGTALHSGQYRSIGTWSERDTPRYTVQKPQEGDTPRTPPYNRPSFGQQYGRPPQQQSTVSQALNNRSPYGGSSAQTSAGQYPPRNYEQRPSRHPNGQYQQRNDAYQNARPPYQPTPYPSRTESFQRSGRFRQTGQLTPRGDPSQQRDKFQQDGPFPPQTDTNQQQGHSQRFNEPVPRSLRFLQDPLQGQQASESPLKASRLESSRGNRAAELDDAIEKEYTLNRKIPSTYVQRVVNGKPQPEELLEELVASLDPVVDCVRCFQINADSKPSIVEVTTRAALREELQQREKQSEERRIESEKARKESKPKQIEFNWAIGPQDLSMKLNNLRKFVEKGKRVEILLAAKKRSRKATPEEVEKVMKQIEQAVLGIEGCKEVKPREGKVGAQLLMTVGVNKK